MTFDLNSLNLHPTLKRQITRYLPSETPVLAVHAPILKAISETYTHADEDRTLFGRSLDLSSKELSENVSLFRATLEATTDGILVVDNSGRIVTYNQKFVDMWHISKEVMATRQDDKAIEFVREQLNDPETFTEKVKELYNQADATGFDILEFKDGRVFERYSIPQKVRGKTVGRVWSFRDVTEKYRSEKDLQKKVTELEKMNRFMIERELKLVNLKKELKALKAKYGESSPAEEEEAV